MKVPSNFTASATKKVNPLEAAINGNFAKPQVSAEQAPAAENPPSDAREPLQTASEQLSDETTSKKPKPAPRREVKEKFLVSMSKGERSVFKSFCALQGVSMNHFVMCAMDYFKEDLENGKVSISAHSYKRRES